MSPILIIQASLWFLYVLAGHRFVSYVFKHAIALHCTREQRYKKDEVIRLFVQNLEDEALQGTFKISIRVTPSVSLDPGSCKVRAGPKQISFDEDVTGDGAWHVTFKSLPPLDTWLFEMKTKSRDSRVEVQISSVVEKTEAPSAGDGSPSGRLSWLRLKPPLSRLATSTLILETGQNERIVGAHSTPQPKTLGWVLFLALAGQWLITWLILTTTACKAGMSSFNIEEQDCAAIGITFPTLYDFVLSGVLCVLVIFCFYTSRRNVYPIAQGYLEGKTRVLKPKKSFAAAPPIDELGDG